MTPFVLALLIAMFFPQQGPPAKTPAPAKLSDSFAKAALLALKTIESDISLPEVKSEQFLTNKGTQEKINIADAEASTKDEQLLTVKLRTIYVQHLIGNLSREVNRLNGKDNESAAIVARESACFKPFEEALRAREPRLPEPCKMLIEDSKDNEEKPKR